MKTFKILTIIGSVFLISVNSHAQTATDVDGNTYNTVTIGIQTWMKENYKALHYADGTDITGTWIYNNDTSMLSIYGRLYDWDAAMKNSSKQGAQGICPDGWHVPTDQEWTILMNHLGGVSKAGGKMKETGTSLWLDPNTDATNSSGFSGLPGGELEGSFFQYIGQYALFWSSTEVDAAKAKYRYLAYNSSELKTLEWNKDLGYSVRCLKDEETSVRSKIENTQKVRVFPNPSEGMISIQFTDMVDKPINAFLYDISGRLLKSTIIESDIEAMDISGLAGGIYTLVFVDLCDVASLKFIKE
ncbi:FISUMP domain-containing protein [Bacteroidota bacterium]